MASNYFHLDMDNLLKLEIVEGQVVACIANTRSQSSVYLSKEGLLRICANVGLIVETCEQAAVMTAAASGLSNAGVSMDFTADDENKENVSPGLPGLRQLRMRLRYSECSDAPVVISDDETTDDEGIVPSQESDLSWEEAGNETASKEEAMQSDQGSDNVFIL